MLYQSIACNLDNLH